MSDEDDCERSEEFFGSKKVINLHSQHKRRKPNAKRSQEKHPYFIKDQAIYRYVAMDDGESERRLCNFVAAIDGEELHDDGEHTDIHYLIDGTDSKGVTLPSITVSSSEFRTMGWVDRFWGARCIVEAGTATKDHLRAAIQHLSDPSRKTIYKHTGWRCLDGAWRYLHGGGALGADGNRSDIEVRCGENHMALYGLGEPPEGDALAIAVKASLGLADIVPAHRSIGLAVLAAVYRAPLCNLVATDFVIWLAGHSGVFKSELAALMLSHFGEFDARHFPATWTDTISDLEANAHATKDALLVVDDFKPSGGAVEINRLHAKADHLIRGAGNQSARGRRSPSMTAMKTFYPRGIVVSTGEDLPRGGSLRARLVVLEISRGGICRERLSAAQLHAEHGLFRQAMAGYVRWLAAQRDELREALPAYQRAFRDDLIKRGLPPDRGATQGASLLIAIDLLKDYALQAGAITADEGNQLMRAAETEFMELFRAKAQEAAETDETATFLRLLKSALLSGRCHLSDQQTQGRPLLHPHACGWRAVPQMAADGTRDLDANGDALTFKPLGNRIGWVNDAGEVLLEGASTYAIVALFARDQGESLPFSERRTWQNLSERGFLSPAARGQADRAGRRLQSKRRIAGINTWVYVINRALLEDTDNEQNS